MEDNDGNNEEEEMEDNDDNNEEEEMEDNNDNKKEEKERRWELVSLSAKKRGGICISQTQSNVFLQKLLAIFLTT